MFYDAMDPIYILISTTIVGHLYVAWMQLKGDKISAPDDFNIFAIRRFHLFTKIHMLFNIFIVFAIFFLFCLEGTPLINYAKISLLLCTTVASIIFSGAFRMWGITLFQGIPSISSGILLATQIGSFPA